MRCCIYMTVMLTRSFIPNYRTFNIFFWQYSIVKHMIIRVFCWLPKETPLVIRRFPFIRVIRWKLWNYYSCYATVSFLLHQGLPFYLFFSSFLLLLLLLGSYISNRGHSCYSTVSSYHYYFFGFFFTLLLVNYKTNIRDIFFRTDSALKDPEVIKLWAYDVASVLRF